MKRKTNRSIITPETEQAKQQDQTTDALLEEDAVQTTAYLKNAAGNSRPETELGNMVGMLGADVTDESLYHSEPTMEMRLKQ